ncbi:MAG: GldG family protein [Spirochaetia bacterium]|nr:GldG family protein [Spirochaetia bacterium]
MKTAFQRFVARVNGDRGLLYFNVIVLFFLTNGVASKMNCRMDWSRDKVNSVSDSTRQVFARLEDPILIEAYISQDVPGEILSILGPVISQLEEIGRVGGKKVRLRIVNPDSEEKRKLAESRGVQGVPLEQERADEITQKLWYFGIYIQAGDKSTVLGIDDGRILDELEYRILKEIKKMTRKDAVSGLGFVRAPGTLDMRRWQNYKDQGKDNLYGFRTFVERDSGTVTDVNLGERVPASVDTLLIAGLPRLEDKEVYHLDQFIMRGGNVILLLKGFDFQLQDPDPQMARLGLGGPGGGSASIPEEDLRAMNAWLGKYGLGVLGEILFEPSRPAPAQEVFGQRIREVPNPAWAVYSRDDGDINADYQALRGNAQVVFPWFSGLKVDPNVQGDSVRYTTLVQTTGRAVQRTSSQMDLREMLKIGGPGDAYLPERHPLAVMATGRFKSAFSGDTLPKGIDKTMFRSGQTGDSVSNILAIGTPYIVSDMLLKNELNMRIFRLNWAFLSNLMEAARGDTELSAARSRVRTIDYLSDTGRGFQIFFTWLHVLTIPLALAIYGTFRLIKRNRRRGIEGGGAS